MSAYTDDDRMKEVADIRAAHVNAVVTRRIDHRDGDATNEQIEQWERDAYRKWRETYPALNSLLIANTVDEVQPEPLGPPISAWSPAPWELS